MSILTFLLLSLVKVAVVTVVLLLAVAYTVLLERKLVALSDAIERVTASGDWRPRPSKLCDWCAHRSRCPAWSDEATSGAQPTLADGEASVGSRLG